MAAGVGLGRLLPSAVAGVRGIQLGTGSQINAPIALLIWLMITPMMMKVDFSSVKNVGRRPTGLLVTLFINWVVKPFSMALLSWAFFRFFFAAFITPSEADQYIAGRIILAAAPCTAMVFVWSHLTNRDAAYTLVRVPVNDLIMLVLFVPIVQFLVHGPHRSPYRLTYCSPLSWCLSSCHYWPVRYCSLLVRKRGRAWFEGVLLPKFAPVTIAALLGTLVLIFAFQADNITGRFFHVLLIAVPITLQVYRNAGLAYGLMKWLQVEHSVAAPGALIGASNFFELAVAAAIALFGPESGAALATVVGVLVEVPVMLSVCAACNRTRHWFPAVERA
jgi:ACR3 family arsenite transporter